MKMFHTVILLLACLRVHGHQSSVSFLFLDRGPKEIRCRLDVPLRQLDFLVGLDGNHDSKITWGEVRRRIAGIEEYVFTHLSFATDKGRLTIRPGDVLIEDRSLGKYLVLQWTIAESTKVNLEYNLFFEIDPGHRCLVEVLGRPPILLSEDSRRTTIHFDAATAGMGAWHTFPQYLRAGITHIFSGIDHICFLLALLLPSVWRRDRREWKPAANLKNVLSSVLKIVTAFTVAHSITLSLAALQLVHLSSVLVESAIALSVFLAAANNIVPIWNDRAWPVAFGFGLMHGFGFASVLGELTGSGSSSSATVLSLFGFNLGVEAGQLCIVLAFVPLAFALRATTSYRIVAVRFGSVVISVTGLFWLIERSFGLTVF